MAASNRGEGSSQSKLSNETPHFFKVVFSPVNIGLRIPIAFMRKHGGSLKNKKVVLKVPTGASWPVKLRQADDGTWLGEGWQKFAAYYGIEMRHFLVFRYEGNSLFHVIIFDPSASEIEYPVDSEPAEHKMNRPVTRRTSQVRKLTEIKSGDDDDDVSVEIVKENPASSSRTLKRRKTGAKKREACAAESDSDASVQIVRFKPASPRQTSEGRKTKVPVKIEQESQEDDVNSHRYHFRQGITKEQSEGTAMPGTPHRSIAQTVTDKEAYSSYRRARAFTSENPFFLCFMQPSYVTHNFYLSFGLSFAGGDLPRNKICDLELRLPPPCRKVWPLNCRMSGVTARARRGWKEFVEANSLLVGDVCVFELVKGTLTFKVAIFRKS